MTQELQCYPAAGLLPQHVTMAPAKQEIGLVPIREISIRKLKPSPENDRLYRPVDPDDVDIIGLAGSIAEIGLQEPSLANFATDSQTRQEMGHPPLQ